MKATIHIREQGVFASTEPKPTNPLHQPHERHKLDNLKCLYEEALKEWEDNLLRVENADEQQMTGRETYWQANGRAFYDGQSCEIELTDNGCRIIKV